MKKTTGNAGRRHFIKAAAVITSGLTGLPFIPQDIWAMDRMADDGIHIIGPKEGYSPHIGTLVSMMNWMRMVVLGSVKDMTKDELD